MIKLRTTNRQNRFALAVMSVWLLCLSLAPRCLAGEVPEADEILATLREKHPRVILDEEGVERIQKLIGRDERAKKFYEELKSSAARILTGPTVQYELVGPRLTARGFLLLGWRE